MTPTLLNEKLMTRKEARFVIGWSKTTLWRRERDGLPFIDNRIGSVTLAWWVELYDAAKVLRKSIRSVWRWPLRRQQQLLKQAYEKKTRRRI